MTETQNHELQEELLEPLPLSDVPRLAWHPAVVGDPPSRATKTKERWAVNVISSRLLALLDGARIIHRGDCDVVENQRPSFKIVGDLDVSWQGRSGVFESHAYMPRIALRSRIWDNGLDLPMQGDYLNEQIRSGRPFYVIWAWWATDDLHPRVIGQPGADLIGPGIRVMGKRVDLLGRPHESSPGKSYWPLSELWPLEKVAEDFRRWSGLPRHEALL